MEKQETLQPNTTYGWSNDAEFVLSGIEFGTLYNSLNAVLGSPEYTKRQQELINVGHLLNSHNLLKGMLEKAVADGVATPKVDAPPPPLAGAQ